jgi:hypothetical protein
MPFTSLDDLVNKLSGGQSWRADWNKLALPTTAQVAGQWHDLSCGPGNPAASDGYGTGTNLAFQALDDTSITLPGIQHGGNVSPATKHLLNASAFTASPTAAPGTLMLVDRLGFYPVTTTTLITAQALSNAVPVPVGRHTLGQGLRAYIVCSSGAATTPMGAGAPNITLNYTNQAGTAGRVTPSVLPQGNTAAPKGTIVHSGTGAAKYGPFIPLQGGDSGIQSVQSIQLSATYTSGVLNLVICRPIMTLPLAAVSISSERDLLNQVPSLPRIFDGANLGLLFGSGVATPVNSSFIGHLDFAWG